jgi:hypothetical protein
LEWAHAQAIRREHKTFDIPSEKEKSGYFCKPEAEGNLIGNISRHIPSGGGLLFVAACDYETCKAIAKKDIGGET